ncbi:response regulator [Nitrospira sp. NS4]|uniref:response regulator n=1 Tax=Nitrospira sp. NS4 TaxID=3414498 RepID=UPI003C2B2A64
MGRRLLIIDDDPMVCEVLKDRLEAMGYAVLVANDGRTGLALMALESKQAPIGGVLLDMHMPVMDGLQVLRELRARHGPVQVVMMTADPDHRIREEAFRLGASHYVEKPFDTTWFAQLCEQTFPLTNHDP